MSLYSLWLHELLNCVYERVHTLVIVIILVAACMAISQEYLLVAAKYFDVRVGLSDALIMLTSPTNIVFSIPQIILGPLSIVVLYLTTRSDCSYNYRVRLGTRGVWARKLFYCGCIVVGVSTIYLILLVTIGVERFGVHPVSFGESSFFELNTNITIQKSPSLPVVLGLVWLDTFVVVGLEVVGYCFVLFLTKNSAISIALVIIVAQLSTVFFKLPLVLGMGYFFYATDNHILLILSILAIILSFIVTNSSYQVSERKRL